MKTQQGIRWTVGLRLAIGATALFIIMTIIVGIGLWTNNQINDQVRLVNDVRVPTIENTTRAQEQLLRALTNIRAYLALGDPKYKEAALQNMTEFEVALADLEQLSTVWTSPEGLVQLNKIKTDYTAWSSLPQQMFNLHDNPLANEPARKILIEQAGPQFDAQLAAISAMIDEQATRSFTDVKEATDIIATLKAMADYRGSLGPMNANLRGYLATGETEFIDNYKAQQAKNEAAWQRLNELNRNLTSTQGANLTRIASARDVFAPLPEQMFAIYSGEHQREDLYLLANQAAPQATELVNTLRKMADSQTELLEDNLNSSLEAIVTQTQVMLLAAGLGLVIGVALTWFNTRSVVNPLANVTHVAEGISKGELDRPITVNSSDEIGDLAAAFQRMTAYIQEIARVAGCLAQGDVTATITPQSDKDVLGNAFSQMITYQQQMAWVAGRLAQGDVTATITPQSDKDVLGNAFSQMITYQQQMAGVAGRLAQGDVTVNITPQSDKDVLGNAFSQMIINLRDLINQVADTANTVGDASGQLAMVAGLAGQATQQVAATIQQVAQGTNQQTQAVTQATGNIEQMARAADGIARGAQEQAQGIQRTSNLIGEMANIVEQVGQGARTVTEANAKVTQAARHGVAAIQQTTQGMDTIRARSTTAADKVKEMGVRSKEIGRIVETIDDIADKTDMLALNAAVEAARAGEHGRGFAVVADQVRKLSEDSKGATRDIANLIERVQEAVREAVAAMESTVTEVGHGAHLAGDTAQSLEEILQAAEQAAALAERIGGAVGQLRQKSEGVVAAMEAVSAVVEENTAVTEEMAAGSQEVMQAMEGVASVTEENSASAEEVSASAEEMSAQVEEVVASAQELSALAEQLQAAVAQFQVNEVNPTQYERSDRGLPLAHVSPSRQQPQAAPWRGDRPRNGYTN